MISWAPRGVPAISGRPTVRDGRSERGVTPHVSRRALRATVGMIALVGVASCTSRTKVEIDSARAPVVEPVDGDGRNDVSVVDAGVVQIDGGGVPSTSASTSTASTSVGTTTPSTSPGQADEATADECEADERMLDGAVERFRADTGSPPASEAELVVDGYIRRFSQLYDVQYNGVVVPQGTGCPAAR
jgi:hypothetical protein